MNFHDGDDDDDKTQVKMRLFMPLALTNANIPRKNNKINRKGKLCRKKILTEDKLKKREQKLQVS